MIKDEGPWRRMNHTQSGPALYSDDFTHDVVLQVNGDFEDRQQKAEYVDGLIDQLNKSLPEKGK